MRCFTPSEFDQLGLRTHIPPDLRTNYFPVLVRELEDSEKRIDEEDVKNALSATSQMTGAKTVLADDKIRETYFMSYEGISASSEYSCRPGVGRIRHDRVSRIFLFTIKDLLSATDLRKLRIEQEPGYIYFCAFEYSDDRYNSSHLFGENDRRAPTESYHDPYAHGLYFRDLIDISRLWYCEDVSADALPVTKNVDIDTHETVWFGSVADIARVTNSLILGMVRGEDGSRTYVLKTPLEYPPGFVRETACLLKQNTSLSEDFVQLFQELVFQKTEPPERDEPVNPTVSVNGFNRDYPQGEAKLIGPDVWWKWSKNPHLVQTVLMARLIGGNFWEYALGNLELNLEEVLYE